MLLILTLFLWRQRVCNLVKFAINRKKFLMFVWKLICPPHSALLYTPMNIGSETIHFKYLSSDCIGNSSGWGLPAELVVQGSCVLFHNGDVDHPFPFLSFFPPCFLFLLLPRHFLSLSVCFIFPIRFSLFLLRSLIIHFSQHAYQATLLNTPHDFEFCTGLNMFVLHSL